MTQEIIMYAALAYYGFAALTMVFLLGRIGQYRVLKLLKKTSEPDFSSWYTKMLAETGRRA